MEIRWLTYLNSKKRHAFPVDEKRYGDWSICGRGSHTSKSEGDEPLCGKCLEILNRYSEKNLEIKRMSLTGDTDFGEGEGS
jgi:hypothetical protein